MFDANPTRKIVVTISFITSADSISQPREQINGLTFQATVALKHANQTVCRRAFYHWEYTLIPSNQSYCSSHQFLIQAPVDANLLVILKRPLQQKQKLAGNCNRCHWLSAHSTFLTSPVPWDSLPAAKTSSRKTYSQKLWTLGLGSRRCCFQLDPQNRLSFHFRPRGRLETQCFVR